MAQTLNFDDPITLYRGQETKVTHSQKQYDEARALGFGPYVSMEWPRLLYRLDPLIDGGVRTEKANSPEHESQLTAADNPGGAYQREPIVVAPKPPVVAATPAVQADTNAELLRRLTELEAKMAASEGVHVPHPSAQPGFIAEPAAVEASEIALEGEIPAVRRRR